MSAKNSIFQAAETAKLFDSWFSGSKIVDESGSALKVFHGTKGNFTSFKTPAWFSNSYEFADLFSADWGDGERTSDSKVIEVYLSIKNPILTDDWSVTESLAYKKEWVAEMQRKGHDGVIFKDGSEIEYIVFNPNQVMFCSDLEFYKKNVQSKKSINGVS